MSLFGSILEKLGIKKPAATPPPAPSSPSPSAVRYQAPTVKRDDQIPSAPKPAAMPMVDVVAKLTALGKSKPDLDWKVSIVDLLKLLDLPSDFNSRKELATELGCPANLMGDSASMNTWLHKMVLQKIAENGGNIPQSLLH